jgi:hypothetical protein
MQCKQNHNFLCLLLGGMGIFGRQFFDCEGLLKYTHIVSFKSVENGDLAEKMFWAHNVCFFLLCRNICFQNFSPRFCKLLSKRQQQLSKNLGKVHVKLSKLKLT